MQLLGLLLAGFTCERSEQAVIELSSMLFLKMSENQIFNFLYVCLLHTFCMQCFRNLL